jgi:diguanylate cyclase (GGDEF)-like protein/PAS domain S-box-containing protein
MMSGLVSDVVDGAGVADVADVAEEYEALLQFLYLAPVGLAQTALDGEIVMINPISAQLLMPLAPNGDLTNLFTALEGIAPELRHLVANFAPASGMVCDALRLQLSAGAIGKSDPRMLSLSLLKLDGARLMAVLSDVSQQVKREKLLRQNEAWFNAIFTGITDYALVSLDRLGRVEDWNESIGRVTGFDRAAVVGKPYSVFYPDASITSARVLDRLRDADESGWSLDDGWRSRADGGRYWGSAMITPLHERPCPSTGSVRLPSADDESSYCLVIRDITDKREASEKLRLTNDCDHLTGIANRRTFFEEAEVELARWRRVPRPVSLLMLDADLFKGINDRHGHAAGDAVLRDLALALKSTFREVDIVARVGGEEFAVLLPSAAIDDALRAANRLLTRLAQRVVEVEGARITYTVSGGLAAMDASVSGLDVLMKRADDALYAAKNGGRNQIVCWGAE